MKSVRFVRPEMLAALALAAVPSKRVECGEIKLATDAGSGRAVLQDIGAGVAWDLGPGCGAALSDDGGSVVLRRIDGGAAEVRLLDGALEIAAEDKGCALVPVREGLLIPADGGAEFRRAFPSSGYEGCHLNMMGFVKQGAALLMTWDGAYVRPELAKTKRSLKCSVYATRPPHAAESALSITLTPLGRGDWNTIAAAYRKMADAKGLAVTLAAKARRNPETEKLFGASNAKLWTCLARRRNEDSTRDESVEVKWTFDEAAQIAEHLRRDLGIDRCLFTIGGWTEGGYDCRHPDVLPANPECGGNGALADAVGRIKALGYVACFHDNYQDMYRDAKSWDPGCIQKRADGSPMKGGRWLGGRAWLVCAPKTLELARRPENLPAVRKLFAPQAYFIDTTFAVDPQECHDPQHPLNRNDDIRWKQSLSDYSRDVFGLFGSECGREWAIPHSEFFEGLSGVSGRYFHNLDPGGLGATVVPLFEMVYHDCEIVFGKYGYSPEAAAEYVAHHVLCARTLNYHRFDTHLYWKQSPAAGAPGVNARPGVVSVTPSGERKFQIRYRWEAEADCAGDWKVFVHFGRGEKILFQNDHAPARSVSGWRKGECIEEGPFEVAVPADVPSDAVDVFMGLCRASGGSSRARLPGCGPDDRVAVGRLRLKPSIAFEKPASQPVVGDPACFVRGDNGWAEGMCAMDRFVKNTHEILGPLAAATAHSRLERFEFLTADRAVRRVTFGGSGAPAAAVVTVNFGAESFVAQSEEGGAVALPAWGFLIESPGLTAFHAASWGGRSYEAAVLFAVRMKEGKARVFHGFGDSRLVWHGRELDVRKEMELRP